MPVHLYVVIVRLDRTIQNLLKSLDSPIKSGNDRLSWIYFVLYEFFTCLLFTIY